MSFSFALRAVMVGLITFLAVPCAVAAPDLTPGIIGEDNRVAILSDEAPFDAIGHVNVAGYRVVSHCSGVLIRPDMVVTAAHCLLDTRSSAPVHADRVHFLQAVRGPLRKGQSTAKCLWFLAPTQARNRDPRFDIAIILLNQALEVQPLEIAEIANPPLGLKLVHASYPADRRHRLSADRQCQLRSNKAGLWWTDCDTHPASSGGPVFIDREGTLQLAAIMVGVAEQSFTIAIPSTRWTDLVRRGIELIRHGHCG